MWQDDLWVRTRLAALVVLLAVTVFQRAQAQDIVVEDGAFIDAERERSIPYRLYRPATLEGPHPVVIFCHGLGGSREGAAYLGAHLADHGYLALHIEHPGTNRDILQGAQSRSEALGQKMRQATRDRAASRARFEDVPFVVDQLEVWNASGRLAGAIDLSRIGMSGHSYGAVSTLVAAGKSLVPGGQFTFKEPRIVAAIAYSPNTRAVRGSSTTYREVDIPILHVTGTEDGDPLGARGPDFDPATRTLPFAHIDFSPQYLLVFDGADHMVFSGRVDRQGPRPNDEAYWELTKTVSLAFWDAHLRSDRNAAEMLEDGPWSDDPLVASWDLK